MVLPSRGLDWRRSERASFTLPQRQKEGRQDAGPDTFPNTQKVQGTPIQGMLLRRPQKEFPAWKQIARLGFHEQRGSRALPLAASRPWIGAERSAPSNACSSSSELDARLKGDHARRVVASQTDAKQAGRRRRGVGQTPETSLRGMLSWNAGQHHAWKSEIGMVENIEELSF
jgi:hypothetical protein